MAELPPKLKSVRVLHLVWALLAIAVSLVLATSRGGHPPAIILLPVVLVAWVLGHAFLALIHHAVRRQAPRAESGAPTRWPIPILTLLVLAAGSVFFAINAEGWSILMNVEKLSWHQMLRAGFMLVGPGIVVAAILLRKEWGRFVAAIAPALFLLYFTVRTLTAFAYWSKIGPGEWLVAAVLFVGSAGLLHYLLKSKSAAEFFRG